MIYMRIFISILLLIGVYKETGVFTVTALFLCLTGNELILSSIKKAKLQARISVARQIKDVQDTIDNIKNNN